MNNQKKTDELTIAKSELAFQNEENKNGALKLMVAYKEIAFQIEEKGKRAAELVIANEELTFQNTEKENRAAELVIANKELISQNREKENRAAELVTTKKITRAVTRGQEIERNYIGLELHDNINQLLAGTKMHLSSAGKRNNELKQLIKYPIELIDSSIQEIRILCQRLVTPNVDVNLQQLIEDLLSKMMHRSSIHRDINFEIHDDILCNDLKLNIYRIVQEQINNILKYADAKKVTILLKVKDKMISLFIEDDGKGFDVNARRDGIGISNMKSRVESFSGTVSISSISGKGCKIMITIPVS